MIPESLLSSESTKEFPLGYVATKAATELFQSLTTKRTPERSQFVAMAPTWREHKDHRDLTFPAPVISIVKLASGLVATLLNVLRVNALQHPLLRAVFIVTTWKKPFLLEFHSPGEIFLSEQPYDNERG